MPFQIGLVVSERYQIVKQINEGGMSYIYLAEDIKLHRRKVVCKIMKSQYSNQNYLIEREAETLIGLNHLNLPKIFDVFLFEQFPVIVMEYVEGEVLSETMSLTDSQKLFVLYQVCEVMSYLHDRAIPILHCDLKPNNILLDAQLNIKLIDFGISSLEVRVPEYGVRTERLEFGTPLYMAPEILNGEKPTTASDLYSFGMIVLFMCGKEKLFKNLSHLSVEQFTSSQLIGLLPILTEILYYVLQPCAQYRKYSFNELKSVMLDGLNAIDKHEVSHNKSFNTSIKGKRELIAVLNMNKCAGATTISVIASQILSARIKQIACIEIANDDANLCKSYLGIQADKGQTLFGYTKVTTSSVQYYFTMQGQKSEIDIIQLAKLLNQLNEHCIIVDCSSIPERFSLLHHLEEFSKVILISTSDVYLCAESELINAINNLRSYKGEIIHINNKVAEKEHKSFLQRWLNIKQYIEIPYIIESKEATQKIIGKWLHPKLKTTQVIKRKLKRLM